MTVRFHQAKSHPQMKHTILRLLYSLLKCSETKETKMNIIDDDC